MNITICQLRREYPHHDFYFFKDGKELQKAPFFHSLVKSFEVKNGYVFIEI